MQYLEDIISKVLEIDPAVIKDSTRPADIESWDSFNGLMLVAELEKQYNLRFSIEEVISVKNVGDIRKILRQHGIDV